MTQETTEDPPMYARDLVTGERRDIMLVGHMPNLPAVLETLAPGARAFPLHGFAALETTDRGQTWTESWRL